MRLQVFVLVLSLLVVTLATGAVVHADAQQSLWTQLPTAPPATYLLTPYNWQNDGNHFGWIEGDGPKNASHVNQGQYGGQDNWKNKGNHGAVAVPEPSSWLLLAIGIVGAVVMVRHRRYQH